MFIRLRLFLTSSLWGGFFILCFAFPAQARADAVWVALSSEDPVYLETARAIRDALPLHEVRINEWDDFDFNTASPKILVTVGSEALKQLHPATRHTRIVAVLAPRSALDEYFDAASAGQITGVYYEQPFHRLAGLLRAAFPEKSRVGIVLGPASARYRNVLTAAFGKLGMATVFETISDKAELSNAVQNVLAKSDLFLALPDAMAINNQTAKFILLASYRRGIPVVGYSAAFVKAGATIAMVSSPTQIGKEAARMVNEALSGKRIPTPRSPQDFEVLVNSSVSRSLNLNLNAVQLERRVHGEAGTR